MQTIIQQTDTALAESAAFHVKTLNELLSYIRFQSEKGVANHEDIEHLFTLAYELLDTIAAIETGKITMRKLKSKTDSVTERTQLYFARVSSGDSKTSLSK